MDFIPLNLDGHFSLSTAIGIFCSIGLVALLLGSAVVKTYKDRSFTLQSFSLAAVAIIAGVGSFMFVTLPPAESSMAYISLELKAYNARIPQIQEAVEDTYGLELTSNEADALNYPLKKPTEDFKVFGSFDQETQVNGAGFEKRTIYLVWTGKQFELSQSSDGESFSPLEATK